MDNFDKAHPLKLTAYQDHFVRVLEDGHCRGEQNNNKRRHKIRCLICRSGERGRGSDKCEKFN